MNLQAFDGRALLALHAYVTALLCIFVTVVWGLTGPDDDFWPAWVWQGVGAPLALHWAWRRAGGDTLKRHVAVAGVAGAVVASTWAMSGGDGTWVTWPLFGLVAAVAAHAAWKRFGLDLRTGDPA